MNTDRVGVFKCHGLRELYQRPRALHWQYLEFEASSSEAWDEFEVEIDIIYSLLRQYNANDRTYTYTI